MAQKPKIKLSKKELEGKYPAKVGKDEEVVRFAGKLVLAFGVFLVIALTIDVVHFTH